MHAPAGLIEPELLLLAYRSGVFPMADSREDPEVFWVEPRRRAILPLDGLHISRSLAKVIRRDAFAVTCNRAFGDVMQACAGPRRDGGDTWISGRIEASYKRLHELGAAHSIEVWQGEALVGGLYGVGFDRVFCGESMFSRVPDASKVALVWLVAALRRAGVELLDCQFITPHLATMGAVEITQARYKKLLGAAQRVAGDADAEGLGAADAAGFGAAGAGAALSLPEGFGALLEEVAGAGSSSSPGKRMLQSFTQTS
jgi:leucyl/phenylalanyl-tRNA--protein transferase